ncbi:MAG: cell division protein ZapA [Clostridiaceae bacterium]
MAAVTVKVNGFEYNLKGEEDEKYLKGIAEYVNSKIKELIEKNPKLNGSSAIVLAAINITDELFKGDIQYDNLTKEFKIIKGENIKLMNKISELKDPDNIIKNAKKEVESYKSQCEIMEEQFKKLKEQNKVLIDRNKEINYQLQSYKYRVLDMEKKYMDLQYKLVSAQAKDNVLLRNKK